LQAALREQPPVVLLVGNKSDKSEEDRQVGLEEGRRLAVVRIIDLFYHIIIFIFIGGV